MRAPDIHGPVGYIWEVPMELPGGRGKPDWDASLACWLLRSPHFHPAWTWWSMSLIHLRPLPNVKPPVIRMQGATHEFLVMSCDPSGGEPDVDDISKAPKLLTPPDVEQQFIAESDAQALEGIRKLLGEVVKGRLSPDSDYRAMWRFYLTGQRVE